MGLFPPWVEKHIGPGANTPIGYHLVFDPPTPTESKSRYITIKIDSDRLIVQYLTVALAAGAIALWFSGRHSD